MVRELVTKFTEQNVTVQRNQANLTSQFLGDEMKQAKDRMDNLEHALMKFKSGRTWAACRNSSRPTWRS